MRRTDGSRETSGGAVALASGLADGARSRVDFHVHSTMSDCSDTFEQVLAQARERGIECLAFTNHDTTAGLAEARELGERMGVQVVGGIEVSAYDFERGRKVHVLGLGIEEGAPALAALCGPVLERRNANTHWQLDRLVEAGYAVDVGAPVGTEPRVDVPVQAAPHGRADRRAVHERGLSHAVPQLVQERRHLRPRHRLRGRARRQKAIVEDGGWQRRSSHPGSSTATTCCPTSWHAASAASGALPSRPRARRPRALRGVGGGANGLVCTGGRTITDASGRWKAWGCGSPALHLRSSPTVEPGPHLGCSVRPRYTSAH